MSGGGGGGDDDDGGGGNGNGGNGNGNGGAGITYAAPALPAWLTFDGVDTIAGTPQAAHVGTHSVRVTASDGTVTVEQNFQILVNDINSAPVLQGGIAPDPQNTIAQEPYTFNVAPFFADPDGNPLTFGAANLPNTLAIDAATGIISGTPNTGDAERSPFVVRVTASDGSLTASDSFTLNVVRPNTPPRLDSPIAPDPQAATAGTAYRFAVAEFFSDPDGDDLSFSASGLPQSLSIAAGSGVISGRPADADASAAPFTVTVSASDGEGSASDSFTLNIARADRPPQLQSQIAPDPQTAVEGRPFSFNVASFFSDPDGDALTFRAANLPPSLSINSSTGLIGGTPSNADIRTTPVTAYDVTITASSSGGSATDSFRLNVENVNQPPSLPDPPPRLSTNEDTALQVTPSLLRAEDPDRDDLSVVLAPPGPDDHFTLNGARVQPEADYHGSLNVEARVNDGTANSNAVRVTIDVVPRNDAPRGGPVPAQTATENSPFTLDLAQFFSDVEDDTLSYSASGLPAGVTLEPSTGLVSGMPPLGVEPGAFSVDLEVSDGSARLRTDFTLSVLRAGRADLSAAITAAPNPVAIDGTVTWTISVQNNSQSVDVANIDLHAVFAMQAPPTLNAPSNAACTLTPAGNETALDCPLGPLTGGAAATVTVTGTAAQAGDVSATATVSIRDAVPIDETTANDVARTTLLVAERLSAGPVQQLPVADARASAAGDLNGDGAIDLAVASGAADGVVVFAGGADPANANKRLLSTAPIGLGQTSAANGIGLADLDGDLDLDLVTANAAGVPDAVLLNSGSAAFTASPLSDSATLSQAVALGDIDGDGWTDIVLANERQSAVHTNSGAGTFTLAARLGRNDDSRDVAIANLLGDALPELVFANANRDATVYRRTSAAAGFEEIATLPTGATTSVAAADFDNDGDLDLVFGRAGLQADASNPVYRNDSGAAPAFSLAHSLGAAATVDVLSADVDGDGDADIVSVNAEGGHQLYINSGASAGFTLHPEQLVAAGSRSAAVGKIGVDDRVDLAVIGADGVAVFFSDGRGNFGAGDDGAPSVRLNGEPTVTITVGDVYADAGATAVDDIDGDLTAKIVADNPVDPAVVGTYTVTYRVLDSSGNAAAPVTRSVQVQTKSSSGGGGGGAIDLELLLLLLLVTFATRARRHPV